EMSGIPVKDERAENIPNPKLKPTAHETLPEGTFVSKGQKPLISEPTSVTSDPATNKEGTAAPAEANPGDPLARVWKESWRDIYDQLEYHERSTMYRALKAGRAGQPLEATYAETLNVILPKLDKAWADYRAEAAAALVTLPEHERMAWLEVLAGAG